MNSNKRLCMLLQRSNTTNNDYMKQFDAYIKVIESYRGKTPIQPGLLKSKLTKMGVQDTNNPTQEEKYKPEEEFREEYIAYIMLYEADIGRFGTIRTDLEKKVTCVSDSYPNTKDDTMGIINN